MLSLHTNQNSAHKSRKKETIKIVLILFYCNIHSCPTSAFCVGSFQGFEGVHRCYLDETLHTIIDRLTDAGVSERALRLLLF